MVETFWTYVADATRKTPCILKVEQDSLTSSQSGDAVLYYQPTAVAKYTINYGMAYQE